MITKGPVDFALDQLSVYNNLAAKNIRNVN